MKEIADMLNEWGKDDEISLATVVSIGGSGVRGVGATMAVNGRSELTGSVSGGCIEGAVVQVAENVLRGGDTPRLLRFCAVDDELFGSFSPCGGEISIMVYRGCRQIIGRFKTLQDEGSEVLWGVSLEGGSHAPGLTFAGSGSEDLLFSDGSELVPSSLEALLGGLSRENLAAGFSDENWFVYLSPSPVRIFIIGGGHISIALCRLGKAMGWKVTIIDPREIFAGSSRFPGADRVMNIWPETAFREIRPDSRTAVAALSHDEKIDDQAVASALAAGCFYVGVLGSRKTLADRKARLASLSVSEAQLTRIKGPIGLNIGAQTPEEIALATAAQIVESLNRGKE
jgi:xanthine dehydrogenase accessory factor